MLAASPSLAVVVEQSLLLEVDGSREHVRSLSSTSSTSASDAAAIAAVVKGRTPTTTRSRSRTAKETINLNDFIVDMSASFVDEHCNE